MHVVVVVTARSLTMELEMDAKTYRQKKWAIVFDFLDINQDGVLSIDELMSYPIKLLSLGNVEMGVRVALLYKGYWDRVLQGARQAPGTLKMDKQTFIAGLEWLTKQDWFKEEFLPVSTDIYFDSIDHNNDGSISFSEWVIFYQTRGIYDEKFHRASFAKLDKDGNGLISRSEFKHGFEMFGLNDDPSEDYSFMYNRKQ